MFSREKIVAYMPIGKWSTPNHRNGSKKKKMRSHLWLFNEYKYK